MLQRIDFLCIHLHLVNHGLAYSGLDDQLSSKCTGLVNCKIQRPEYTKVGSIGEK